MMTKEEKVREEINELVMTLFDAADLITSLENDGAGDLAEVFDEIGRQVGNINKAIGHYLDADREYTKELEYPDGYCD
jgi:hypothetical protein